MLEKDYQQVLAKAVNYCARAEKCVFDVRKKMSEWGIDDESSIQKVIDYLKDNNFIDHQRYVDAFVNDALRLKKYGKLKIRYLLMQKRIENGLIEAVLRDIDPNQYENLIRSEIEKRLKSKKNDETEKQKLIRSLMCRGFETELVKKLLDERGK